MTARVQERDVHLTVAVTETTVCRLCGAEALRLTWALGATPLANAHPSAHELDHEDRTVPLDLMRCEACGLVQLRHTVSPEVLFRAYQYVSSTSGVFRAHFEDYARDLQERFHLGRESLVVDVGSNDGILLKPLRNLGLRVLGIEPAQRIAAGASAEDIETVPDFFSPALARQLRAQRGPAQVITANNVFAHTPDVAGFVRAVQALLADDGVFVFEVQYLGDLLQKNLFDNIYHEHLCYYHLSPLVAFFTRLGMKVFDVQRVAAHGGSIRVFVERREAPHTQHPRVARLLQEELAADMHGSQPLKDLADRVARNTRRLEELLSPLRQAGKRLVGYGAPAKATTFLYTLGIGAESLAYIVDDDRNFKQGRFMPGSHIPIVSPEYLYKPFDTAQGKPDYCLILAWNFAEPIMKNHARFTEQGGRFIVPVPEPHMV